MINDENPETPEPPDTFHARVRIFFTYVFFRGIKKYFSMREEKVSGGSGVSGFVSVFKDLKKAKVPGFAPGSIRGWFLGLIGGREAMGTLETREKLKQWGAWQRGLSVGLGYGVNTLAIVRGGGSEISDEEALGIDRVMAILKRFNYEQYRCVKLAYVDQKSTRAIGRDIDIPARTVQLRIEQAEHWIGIQLGTH